MKTQKRRFAGKLRKQAGFTLLEVLVALGLGSTAAVNKIPELEQAADKVVAERAASQITEVIIASRHFRAQNPDWPSDVDTLIAAGLLPASAALSPFNTPYTLVPGVDSMVVSVDAVDPMYARLLTGVSGIPFVEIDDADDSVIISTIAAPGSEAALDAYMPLDGSAPMEADLDMGGNNIIEIAGIDMLTPDGNPGTITNVGEIDMTDGDINDVNEINMNDGEISDVKLIAMDDGDITGVSQIDMNDGEINDVTRIGMADGSAILSDPDGIAVQGSTPNSSSVKLIDSNGNYLGELGAEGGSVGIKNGDGEWAFQSMPNGDTVMLANGVEKIRATDDGATISGNLDMEDNKVVNVAGVDLTDGSAIVSNPDGIEVKGSNAGQSSVKLTDANGDYLGELGAEGGAVGIKNENGEWAFQSAPNGETVMLANGVERIRATDDGAAISGDLDMNDNDVNNIDSMNEVGQINMLTPDGQAGSITNIRQLEMEDGSGIVTNPDGIAVKGSNIGQSSVKLTDANGTYLGELGAEGGAVGVKNNSGDWAFQSAPNGDTIMLANGVEKIRATDDGATISGDLDMDDNDVLNVGEIGLSDGSALISSVDGVDVKGSNAGQSSIKLRDSNGNYLGELSAVGGSVGVKNENGQWAFESAPNGNTVLYSNGVERIRATDDGATISGNLGMDGDLDMKNNNIANIDTITQIAQIDMIAPGGNPGVINNVGQLNMSDGDITDVKQMVMDDGEITGVSQIDMNDGEITGVERIGMADGSAIISNPDGIEVQGSNAGSSSIRLSDSGGNYLGKVGAEGGSIGIKNANDQWAFESAPNGNTIMYSNGVERIRATNDGATVTGILDTNKLVINNATDGEAAIFDTTNGAGVVNRFTNNGALVGEVGSGSQIAGGDADDFGINADTGDLIFAVGGQEAGRFKSGSKDLLIGTTVNSALDGKTGIAVAGRDGKAPAIALSGAQDWVRFIDGSGNYSLKNVTTGEVATWVSPTGDYHIRSGDVHLANNRGLAWDSGDQTFSADGNTAFVAKTGGAESEIKLHTNGDALRGSLKATDSNQIGLTDQGGHWAIRHENDIGTRFYSNNETPEASIGTGTVTGNYGTMQTSARKGGQGGYSVEGRLALLHDGANSWGIMDDTTNEWLIQGGMAGSNRYVGLRYNGQEKLKTTATGTETNGKAVATSEMVAPKFTDFDDSSYYVMPSQTSILNNVQMASLKTDTLEITEASIEGRACTVGQIGRDAIGEAMSCVSGTWTKMGGGGTCQSGKEYVLAGHATNIGTTSSEGVVTGVITNADMGSNWFDFNYTMTNDTHAPGPATLFDYATCNGAPCNLVLTTISNPAHLGYGSWWFYKIQGWNGVGDMDLKVYHNAACTGKPILLGEAKQTSNGIRQFTGGALAGSNLVSNLFKVNKNTYGGLFDYATCNGAPCTLSPADITSEQHENASELNYALFKIDGYSPQPSGPQMHLKIYKHQ